MHGFNGYMIKTVSVDPVTNEFYSVKPHAYKPYVESRKENPYSMLITYEHFNTSVASTIDTMSENAIPNLEDYLRGGGLF
jgi:hypothetical protein